MSLNQGNLCAFFTRSMVGALHLEHTLFEAHYVQFGEMEIAVDFSEGEGKPYLLPDPVN